jgi:excisionase family DNA binding protein
MSVMEGRSEGKRRLTTREAATLLGVHYNTVRNRIKDGSIEAEKVVTERGPTWMIDPDSLTTNALPSGSQQLVGKVPEEALTVLAREIVREAGLRPDPEREAMLEGNKLEAEAAKTQVLLSSGLLVGMAAVAGVLPSAREFEWLAAALLLVLIAVIAGIGHMINLAREVAHQRRLYPRMTTLPMITLSVGLTCFTWFVTQNIPGPDRELTLAEFLQSVAVGLGIVGLGLAAGWLARRYRSRRSNRSQGS